MKRTAGANDYIGKTNAEAANAGLAPQLNDGNFATLHHLGQDSRGGLAEARESIGTAERVKTITNNTFYA